MNKNTKNFIKPLSVALMTCLLAYNGANAARTTAKAATTNKPAVENKASQFKSVISETTKADDSASLAEMIRKQRATADARDKESLVQLNTQMALAKGSNNCDKDLRKCIQQTCGDDLTKCALDGDTIFGDKLNRCRRDTTCTGEEFQLFTNEIKADLELNFKLSAYTGVINCGNEYNKCIETECGATFGKCLGKTAADRATKKCETIARNCMEQDSGLSARFGKVIGRLRENAEKDVKADEEKMYKLRDKMRAQCETLGARFDERSFDCVYTVNFFAGDDQSKPTASRKAYAGGTFVCMQEWFGVNVTTFKENAYRETRAQTAASSAMLGSGVGTAVGAITSGAIDRAIDSHKAKKDLKEECKSQSGMKFKNGECVPLTDEELDKEKAKDDKKACNSKKGCKWNKKEEKCVCEQTKQKFSYKYFKVPSDPDEEKHTICQYDEYKSYTVSPSTSRFGVDASQCNFAKEEHCPLSLDMDEKDNCIDGDSATKETCKKCWPLFKKTAECRKEATDWCDKMGMNPKG